MSNTIALLPTLPPESSQVEIPRSMNPEEQARLVSELGKISTEIARVQTRDEERGKFLDQRLRAIDSRLGKLEGHADASGQHDLAIVTKALDKATSANDKIKWWALSIATTLITSAIVGLVVHYLATR